MFAFNLVLKKHKNIASRRLGLIYFIKRYLLLRRRGENNALFINGVNVHKRYIRLTPPPPPLGEGEALIIYHRILSM
jgi:hypothetical protein